MTQPATSSPTIFAGVDRGVTSAKIATSAIPSTSLSPLQRPKLLSAFKPFNGHAGDFLKAGAAAFVGCIRQAVPMGILEIDDIDSGNVVFVERNVIVLNVVLDLVDELDDAHVAGRLPHFFRQ